MWEDMLLLPYAVRFYRERLGMAGLRITIYDNESKDGSVKLARALGCYVFSFGSEGELADRKYMEIKSNCWKQSEADWVVIVDLDEWLDIRPADLDLYEARNITIVKGDPSILIWKNDTVDLTDPPYSTAITDSEKILYAKPFLFDRRQITAYAINPGGHSLSALGGQVNWLHDASPSLAAPKLYHVKYFHQGYLKKRYKTYSRRISEENRQNGWGGQYFKENLHEVSTLFRERRQKMAPVPGLLEGTSLFQKGEGDSLL
jgi:hypothetical protein